MTKSNFRILHSLFLLVAIIFIFILFRFYSNNTPVLAVSFSLYVICSLSMSLYAYKKFPLERDRPLWILLINMITMALLSVSIGYQFAIENPVNFFLFIVFFGGLINSVQRYQQYRKERRIAVNTVLNNKKEVL